jgi:EAL domain-containing protein (putative c-di-GMP-specific phosphodiesterase class I)/GGDEF domain-containing protein
MAAACGKYCAEGKPFRAPGDRFGEIVWTAMAAGGNPFCLVSTFGQSVFVTTSVSNEPVLIISPRYADDLAAMAQAAGLLPRIERVAAAAGDRFAAEPARVVVVDARGALAAGMAVAEALGSAVEAQRGAMLVLLSRGDAASTNAAMAAGATSVLVSPFGADSFANALRLADRYAHRLAGVAALPLGVDGDQGDRLTGLADADGLQAWLDAQFDAGHPAGVIVLGISRLQQFSLVHGRRMADRLLMAIARRLVPIADERGPERLPRLLGRLGATEFALGIAGLDDARQLARLAEQLVTALGRPFAVDDRLIHVAGRAGIAQMHAGSGDGLTLLREAGLALANARARDPGVVVRYSPETDGSALARQAVLESDLFQALANEDIALMVQPIASLEDGSLTGAETLVRWDHPVYGRLAAATVLETAASAELAVALGRHIRRRAIRMAAGWRGAMASMRISVNVTAADLADPEFIDTLAMDLVQAGLSPQRLVLEVTEDAMISDLEAAAELLSVLRRDGVRVALDDFGTGYSGLARLARMPVDMLKLDRSFTQSLTGNDRERVVVEGVIGIARRLGMVVVAEGVEDDVQLAAARAAGCQKVQGFLLSPPLDDAGFEEFCRDYNRKRNVG